MGSGNVLPSSLLRGSLANGLIQMGDANASIPTVQPVLPRPMWGATPSAAIRNSICFVSKISVEMGKSQLVRFWACPVGLLVDSDTRYHREIPANEASCSAKRVPTSEQLFNQ